MVGGGFINTQVFGLAWYETYQYNAPKVYAISDDGQRTRVPSNFFGVNSLLFTTNIYMFEQFFEVGEMWTSGKYEHLQESKKCLIKLVKNNNVEISRKVASRMVKMQHAYALEKYKDNPLNGSYNLGYYHSFSPFLEQPFDNINLEKINFYEFVLEAGCLDENSDWPSKNPKILYSEKWKVQVK